MRDGLVGDELGHLHELGDRFFGLIRFLVIDAEIEPRVGKRRVEPLDLFQQCDGFGDSIAVEQRQRVVEFFARGVGGKVECLLEFSDGFDVRGGIFEEGFAEIAVTFEDRFVGGGDRAGRDPDQQRGQGNGKGADRPEPSRCGHQTMMT